MDINNLTNVYNQNPTLQSSYTLQQYLDLFGGSSTPATTTTATTTTPTTTNSGQGIINQNINQYQNQGGDNDGNTGFGDFGNLDESSMKEFNMPGFDNPVKGYKNTSSGLYQDKDGLNIQNLGIGSFGVVGLIEKAFGLDKKDPKYAGLFDKVSYKALMKNPYLAKSFFARQDKKKQDDLQKTIDAANKKAAQEAKNKAEIAAIQTRIDKEYKDSGGGGFNSKNDPTGSKEKGFNMHGDGKMADGGRAGYFFGGRVNYKAGGRTDAGANRTTASKAGVGQINESGQKVSGGNYNNNDGGNNPSFYEPKPTFFNDPEIISEKTILGNIPKGVAFNNNMGRYKAIMDLKNSIEKQGIEGEVEYNNNIGNFDLTTKYSPQDGPTYGVGYTGNNFDVNVDNQTGARANYSRDIGPGTFTAGGTYNPDGTYNAEAKYGISFANGGLASIL